jgi:hypothetical protein
MRDNSINLIGQCSLIAAATLLLSGCHMNRELGPPGTMDAQRARAMQHDPFPTSELGPDISGTRPRGFDLPRTEIQKLQTSPNARRGGQYVPSGF